eukprot:2219007-Pyramimonas_sp.AAC.4
MVEVNAIELDGEVVPRIAARDVIQEGFVQKHTAVEGIADCEQYCKHGRRNHRKDNTVATKPAS